MKGKGKNSPVARTVAVDVPAATATVRVAPDRWTLWIAVALVALNLIAFSAVRRHDFIGFDDPQYVTDNPHVKTGLTWTNVQWAFVSGYANNWHPLTWLSHMLDTTLFGLQPGPHHLTSLALHILNTLLLFGLFRSLTGTVVESAIVAALFGVHPLHVESVAWVAERKDVLSTFFGLLAFWAYVAFSRKQTGRRYVLVIALFTLGLMAKPMLVTLPLVFLLMDVWPLNRLPLPITFERIKPLLIEKLPLVALAAAASAVTWFVQGQGGNMARLSEIPAGDRIYNASLSYWIYIGNMFWPARLAAFYPLFPSFSTIGFIAALSGLIAVTVIAIKLRDRRPYLLVGWLWYVITLLPVIGLVQVGAQSRADRYTYVPLVGLFIILAWGGRDVARKWSHLRIPLSVVAGTAVVACALAARAQASYWKDSSTLWTHSVNLGIRDYLAYNSLGADLWKKGRSAEAVAHFEEALRIRPEYPEAMVNLGIVLADQGKYPEAIAQYTRAIRIAPQFALARFSLASAMAAQGKLDDAMTQLAEAVRLKPDYTQAHTNLGFALLEKGQIEKAITHYSEALRLEPGHANAHYGLALAFQRAGRIGEATREFNEVLRLNPKDADALRALRNLQAPRAN